MCYLVWMICVFFFFQAEDGIRDYKVTGVQTCALPISQLCEYLRELGAGAVYMSPILASASGSEHGYDVVDFSRVDDARGSAEGWRGLVDAAHGLQLVLDVVPNHT